MKRTEFAILTEKQFTNLRDFTEDFIKDEKGIGMVNLFVAHTTCAIKIIEGEILLLSDVHSYLEEIFPKVGNYRHDIIDIRDVPVNERINGFAHMRQLFFDVSCDIPVLDGKLLLGKWQSVYLVEFDPIRERKVIATYYD
jgi:secondary thiamine-phosphate synthase enzyme